MKKVLTIISLLCSVAAFAQSTPEDFKAQYERQKAVAGPAGLGVKTILENWDNTDVNIMPNSVITTNKIQNITRETLVSKVYLTVDVGYGTDVNLARKLIQEAACENPHVITDGSVTRPYTRLDKFLDSNLNIKLGFYVDDYNTQWAVSGQIRQSVIEKFKANGISIDYEQFVIHHAEPVTHEDAAKKSESEDGE